MFDFVKSLNDFQIGELIRALTEEQKARVSVNEVTIASIIERLTEEQKATIRNAPNYARGVLHMHRDWGFRHPLVLLTEVSKTIRNEQ